MKGKVRREAIIERVLSCLPLSHATINFLFEHFTTAIGFYLPKKLYETRNEMLFEKKDVKFR